MNQDQGQVPEALAVPPPISRTTPPTQTKTKISNPLREVIQGQQEEQRRDARAAAIKQKYSSIDSMNRADKIEALKNPRLNPYKLSSPYDGLANSLHRWKTVANDAMLSHYTEEQKTKVASHYYDQMIAPMYGGMKIAPMSKELWLKQAYKEATNYNIEDAYNNSIMHSLKHGWNEGLPDLARAGQYVYNAIGNAVDDAVQLYQNQRAERALPDAQRQAHLARPWHEQALDLHNQIASVKHDSKLSELVNKGAQRQTDEHEFWAAALPTQDGLFNHATSFIAEQAAQLPMYVVMSEGGGIVKGGNLTAKLMQSPAGKRVFGYLMAGAEGYAYGKATRKQEDKAQAWQDGVGFAVFHGLFDVGGMGTKKLRDVASGVAKDALERRAANLELAQKGLRPATAAERYEDHKTEVANNLVVAGIPGQRSIFVAALKHVQDMEASGMSRAAVKEHEMKLLNEDPAQYAPVLSSAKYIRSLFGDKKLSNIEMGSEDAKFLSSRLNQLVMDAGSSLNSHVEGAQESAEQKLEAEVKTPGTARTLDFYKAKVAAELAKDPAAAKMVTPAQIEAAAKKKMAKARVAAAAQAERQLTRNPAREATNVAKRAKELPPPAIKVRTEYKTDRFGQSPVRYDVNPDYKVKLKKYQVEAKAQGKTLTQFFQDMSDADFKDDLSEHFYPKALQKAQIFFEGQNTREGVQNPNFLAFMYNYTHLMPREFGKELEQRLIDTMKVQTFMKGRKPTEPQLMYYAKAMYNHMDNFLGSGRWPQESNIFRSTQEDMWNSTEWQLELLQEKQIQEAKNLRDMFSTDLGAKRAALSAHRILSAKRLEQYAIGPKNMTSQEKIADIDTDIANLQTQTGDYESWVF